VWSCVESTLIEQYWFDEPILECSTIQRDADVMTKVTLETCLIHYISISFIREHENVAEKIHFKLVSTLKEKPEKKSILFDYKTDIYYSEGQSHLYLYHIMRSENDSLQKIDSLPPLNHDVYSVNYYSKEHLHVLIWLTVESVVILHSRCSHFIIPGEYHDIYIKEYSIPMYRTNGPFISCLNRTMSRIDIFELKFNDGPHQYRLHDNVQFNQSVSHFSCDSRKHSKHKYS
jgi:hypothetical protein